MSDRSVSVLNLESGEVLDTDLKFNDNKYIIRGYKMYNKGIEYLIKILTKDELLAVINIFNSDTIDYNNLLIGPFHKLTPQLSKSARSKLKKKLMDENVLGQYLDKRLMLNPFIFIPRGDANVHNSKHLTQRVWKYLFEDLTSTNDAVLKHVEHMFGKLPDSSTHIRVGTEEHGKIIKSPKDIT